jgi:MFS transporter, DHA1 family, multidrug resistance protein
MEFLEKGRMEMTGLTHPQREKTPTDWSPIRKWSIVVTTTLITFMVSFNSSVYSTTLEALAEEFQTSSTVTTLGIVLYVLAFALGPLFWGPASELYVGTEAVVGPVFFHTDVDRRDRYGRTRPLFVGYSLFCIFQLPWPLATNVSTILDSRFLCALFGTSTFAIVPGIHVDILNSVQRGISSAIFGVGVFCCPVLGPVIGTAITQSLSWRWAGWLTVIFSTFFGLWCFACTPETAPLNLARRKLPVPGIKSDAEDAPDLHTFITKYLTKPPRMLLLEPIVRVPDSDLPDLR